MNLRWGKTWNPFLWRLKCQTGGRWAWKRTRGGSEQCCFWLREKETGCLDVRTDMYSWTGLGAHATSQTLTKQTQNNMLGCTPTMHAGHCLVMVRWCNKRQTNLEKCFMSNFKNYRTVVIHVRNSWLFYITETKFLQVLWVVFLNQMQWAMALWKSWI